MDPEMIGTPAFRNILLQAASNGDAHAFEMLDALSYQDIEAFRQMLPVVTQRLQKSCPGSKHARSPSGLNHSTLMIMVFSFLACHDLGAGTNDSRGRSVKKLLLKNATSIMNWMCHLFGAWVFDIDFSRDTSVSGRELQEKIVKFVPMLLLRMTEHREIAKALMADSRIGPLLAQQTVMSARHHLDGTQGLCKRARFMLFTTGGRNQPWEAAFVRSMEFHATSFASGIASQIHRHAEEPYKVTNQLDAGILSDLYYCTSKSDIILAACLEQTRLVRDISTMMCRMITHMAAHKLDGDEREEGLGIIANVLIFLDMAFAYGGQHIIFLALEQNILTSFITLRKVITLEDVRSSEATRIMETALDRVILAAIVQRVVYPRILKSTASFAEEFDSQEVLSSLKSELVRLDFALVSLRRRIDEELVITQRITDAHQRVSRFSDPIKFCDNHLCPSIGKEDNKLGRCVSCSEGYYCSRRCQKTVWKSGHRYECKIIAGNISGAAKNESHPLPYTPLTIHDREYLFRSTMTRFRFYAASSPEVRRALENDNRSDTIIEMDFTTCPVTLHIHSKRSAGSGVGWIARQRHDESREDSTNVPIEIRAKYPACKKYDEDTCAVKIRLLIP